MSDAYAGTSRAYVYVEVASSPSTLMLSATVEAPPSEERLLVKPGRESRNEGLPGSAPPSLPPPLLSLLSRRGLSYAARAFAAERFPFEPPGLEESPDGRSPTWQGDAVSRGCCAVGGGR